MKVLRSFAGVWVQSFAGHVHAHDSADGIGDEACVRLLAFLPVLACFGRMSGGATVGFTVFFWEVAGLCSMGNRRSSRAKS